MTDLFKKYFHLMDISLTARKLVDISSGRVESALFNLIDKWWYIIFVCVSVILRSSESVSSIDRVSESLLHCFFSRHLLLLLILEIFPHFMVYWWNIFVKNTQSNFPLRGVYVPMKDERNHLLANDWYYIITFSHIEWKILSE